VKIRYVPNAVMVIVAPNATGKPGRRGNKVILSQKTGLKVLFTYSDQCVPLIIFIEGD